MVINATPRPIKFIPGTLVGWLCYFLFRRTLKLCLPVVKKRLENTARWKAGETLPWSPPVST